MKSDNMTRVSLREAYDNKDVVAQIYAIRDTAESAVDTSEQAVTTANTASDHVDALVPQVEGAVENANSASASAQASAQTVAGYENRLGAVEDATEDLAGDLNAVTLRVTTAEGQIVTIQGRVTALETADGQNVKINRINDYAVGLTGNQENIAGVKGFLNELRRKVTSNYVRGFLTVLSEWAIGETVSENKAYWPVIVGNSDVTDYPFLIGITELAGGTDQITIRGKGQNNANFGITINCSPTGANITLDAYGKSVVIGSVTRD